MSKKKKKNERKILSPIAENLKGRQPWSIQKDSFCTKEAGNEGFAGSYHVKEN